MPRNAAKVIPGRPLADEIVHQKFGRLRIIESREDEIRETGEGA
jgi:hypothetical protein